MGVGPAGLELQAEGQDIPRLVAGAEPRRGSRPGEVASAARSASVVTPQPVEAWLSRASAAVRSGIVDVGGGAAERNGTVALAHREAGDDEGPGVARPGPPRGRDGSGRASSRNAVTLGEAPSAR